MGRRGLLAYGLFAGRAGRSPATRWPGTTAGRWVAAGVLLAAAGYEFTPLKDVCLTSCRSPLAFMIGAGATGASARCAWASSTARGASAAAGRLMAALFALGVMSLGWMALIAR